MKHLPLILSLLAIAFLTWIYFHKEAGYKQALQQQRIDLDEYHQWRFDSLASELDTAHSNTLKWMEFATKSERSAQRWEYEAKTWKSRHEKEVNNRRHFTDPKRDSLLSTLK